MTNERLETKKEEKQTSIPGRCPGLVYLPRFIGTKTPQEESSNFASLPSLRLDGCAYRNFTILKGLAFPPKGLRK
jgi:hypothetical protein